MRRWIGTAAGVGLGVLGGLTGAAAVTARRLSGPTRRRYLDGYTFTPVEMQVAWEDVRFLSAEGLELRGWWLPRPESRRVIIGCTGHRGGKDQLLGIGSGLWRAGNNVLLFDFRGRGESQQGRCSLAYHEIQDLLGAVAYARQRAPATTLGVIGYSMGAAVAILTAARSPEIAAVVADSSFASMREVVSENIRRRRLPARPVVDLADWLTWRVYGYRFNDVQPVEVVRAIHPRPLLIIHGEGDTLISVAHAQRLYAAAGEPKELWIVPEVEHCGGYFAHRVTYIERVACFFERALGE